MTDRYEKIRAALAMGPTPGSREVFDLSFDWNGTMVWEYVGHAGRKSFPNWLRKVADQMEKKL